MKKTLSRILVLIMLASLLSGCGNDGTTPPDEADGELGSTMLPDGDKEVSVLPDWISGSDAARLLLANERLNAQLLKNDGDIFENGVEVMNALEKTAVANLNVQHTSHTSSNVKGTADLLGRNSGGGLEIIGDTFMWSGFGENNNSYDYFKNITNNIVTNAEIGARLIDDIKTNVRVVDKWIAFGEVMYFLSVDENSELLCEKDNFNNILKICRRYKNGDGKDVYELYSNSDGHEERMTYIPGERYELSIQNPLWESKQYFVADNSKGYWETYILDVMPDHYNVSYFIMKNDICYDAFYDPTTGNVTFMKIMSSDRATDILSMADSEDSATVHLKFGGFNGIAYVEAPAGSVMYDPERGAADLPGGYEGKLHLTNGKVLTSGDSFADGKITVGDMYVSSNSEIGYTGEVMLFIDGETYAERLESLRSFLNETGLECRRDIDSVLNGIGRAYADLESVIKYYTWNGVSVKDAAGIDNAMNKETARFAEMEGLYTAVKDAEVLDGTDSAMIELNIKFAPITESHFDGIVLDAMKVSVGSATLAVEDTTLYVKDIAYKIAFALADANGKLIHFDADNTVTVTYAGEKKFTVAASALEFTLPVLSSGSYSLTAYIATSDGIRVSAYTPVAVSEIVNMPVNVKNMTVSATKTAESGLLTLTYEQIKDFTVTLTTPDRIGYEEFKTIVSETAFEYGIPSDVIEIESGDAYTALTGSESEIVDGTYRISYKVENGDSAAQGYIYVQYACE